MSVPVISVAEGLQQLSQRSLYLMYERWIGGMPPARPSPQPADGTLPAEPEPQSEAEQVGTDASGMAEWTPRTAQRL